MFWSQAGIHYICTTQIKPIVTCEKTLDRKLVPVHPAKALVMLFSPDHFHRPTTKGM